MYSAKTFYELAGVKRSTVRHFVELGLLKPATIQENGYALYGDEQLLDIICIKNERSLDFGIQEIETIRKSNLPCKINQIERRKAEITREIDVLQQKIRTLEMYHRILKEMADQMDTARIDRQGRRAYEAFWIGRSTSRTQADTAEEIAHCVENFPIVRVMLQGQIGNLADSTKERIHMEIGYCYEQSEKGFTPLHPELYVTIPASPGVLLRRATFTPLTVDRERLQPLLDAAKQASMRPTGELYTYVHAVENTEAGSIYYITDRLITEPI